MRWFFLIIGSAGIGYLLFLGIAQRDVQIIIPSALGEIGLLGYMLTLYRWAIKLLDRYRDEGNEMIKNIFKHK